MLVVAGGCEGLTPDITRWAWLLFLDMHVMCVYSGARNFEGLVRDPMLVVAGGCEGLTPDITRWAWMLVLDLRMNELHMVCSHFITRVREGVCVTVRSFLTCMCCGANSGAAQL
jgi:hypothetical protein